MEIITLELSPSSSDAACRPLGPRDEVLCCSSRTLPFEMESQSSHGPSLCGERAVRPKIETQKMVHVPCHFLRAHHHIVVVRDAQEFAVGVWEILWNMRVSLWPHCTSEMGAAHRVITKPTTNRNAHARKLTKLPKLTKLTKLLNLTPWRLVSCVLVSNVSGNNMNHNH